MSEEKGRLTGSEQDLQKLQEIASAMVFRLLGGGPQVEVVEEDTEKALTPTVAREKSLAPKVTPRGGSVGDESGA